MSGTIWEGRRRIGLRLFNARSTGMAATMVVEAFLSDPEAGKLNHSDMVMSMSHPFPMVLLSTVALQIHDRC